MRDARRRDAPAVSAPATPAAPAAPARVTVPSVAPRSPTLMVGVSGVRGLVGTDLTPEFVARWAAAFGSWARDATSARGKRGRPLVVLGRDARTSGPMFAAAARAGLQSVGCDVVDVGLAPTPTVQLAVEHHHAAGGIVLTASHNPIEWNALKLVGPDGIFLDGAGAARVAALAEGGASLHRAGYDALGTVREDSDAVARHVAAVLRLPVARAARVRRRRFTVALDAVRGAGGPIMTQLLGRLGCRVRGIHLEPDGRFPRAPEPVPQNLGELGRLVRRTRADMGFAVDPDVDRLAIVDERGEPIGEDYTLAFAVRAVLGEARRKPRAVVCNLSTSLVVEDAARTYGADLVRTPVGEVHVARRMVELGAVIGGEGNGGVMFGPLHAGRDAPVAAALVLALLRREGRSVSELVTAAPRYVIVKDRVPRGPALPAVYAALERAFADAAVDAQDGLRLAWRDRWLHVRPSNTEPIIRLIAEAPDDAAARRLLEEGRSACAAS